MLKSPTENEIFRFVSSTHALDRIDLFTDDIQNTWNQRGLPNPYAQGHFRAFMYIVHTLLPSNDFPAKNAQMSNLQDSENALFWLRMIHHKIVDPLIGHALMDDFPDAPTAFQVGKYRMAPTMAVMKPAPPSDAIPKLMHNWIKAYATFHDKIKEKVANPYGIDKQTAQDIYRKSYEVNLFFCTVQPMTCLNQRMGRFLENTFRLAWHLPIKYYGSDSNDYRNLSQDIQNYENNTVPQLLEEAKSVK